MRAGVGIVADPEVADIEQPHRGRGRPLEGHPVQSQVGVDPLAGLRQGAGRDGDPVELRAVAPKAPIGVVEVLAASGGVGAGGLQVAVGDRADPHIGPGWRDHQCLDALDLLGVQRVPMGVGIAETLVAPPPSVTGHSGADCSQAGHAPRC